jgi:hypothetical protein
MSRNVVPWLVAGGAAVAILYFGTTLERVAGARMQVLLRPRRMDRWTPQVISRCAMPP